MTTTKHEYQMTKQVIVFGSIKISSFKNLVVWEDVDINNLKVSSVVSSIEKYHWLRRWWF